MIIIYVSPRLGGEGWRKRQVQACSVASPGRTAASPKSSRTSTVVDGSIMVDVPLDEPEPSATPPATLSEALDVPDSPVAPLAAAIAESGEAEVLAVAEVPSAGAEEKSDEEKQARLEGLKAELRLLQVFLERKSAAASEGCPERVRLSVGSMQTKAAGAEQWSDAEPTVVVVEVQPVNRSTAPDRTTEATSEEVAPAESPVNQSVSVLRPAAAGSPEDARQENAEKEQELARLKGMQSISACRVLHVAAREHCGCRAQFTDYCRPFVAGAVELALLSQRKSCSKRQKKVMEANHLWFGQSSIEISNGPPSPPVSALRQKFESPATPNAEAEPVEAADPVITHQIRQMKERSAQRAAELEAARAELAALNSQLRDKGESLRGAGTVRVDEMMDAAAVVGVLRPSPHKGCEMVIV